ncbi:MAG TPA: hypothetical protein ENJ19_11185 [Gammaproteobacteria bacterium]|nr:hypothetical protein [Gammaproteobacteria bacterium]
MMQTLLRQILLGGGLALAFGPVLAAGHAVVLAYHHFDEPRYRATHISSELFARELDLLIREGFHIVALPELIERWSQDEAIPDKTVAITIDDAHISVYRVAYPLLRERQLPFTVFVATDYIDEQRKGYMSWDELRDMQAHGASFANHSTTHASLALPRAGESVRAWLQRARRNILRAQDRLEKELGPTPPLFAYPFGEYSQALADLVDELGLIGFGQHSGAIGPHSDPRALPRFPLSDEYPDLNQFLVKASSLALPVVEVSPWEPVTLAKRPALTVTLDGKLMPAQDIIDCYAGKQGRIEVQWISRTPPRFQTEAPGPLPVGRSRYNCIAPSKEAGRYYWYSHPWLRTSEDGL